VSHSSVTFQCHTGKKFAQMPHCWQFCHFLM